MSSLRAFRAWYGWFQSDTVTFASPLTYNLALAEKHNMQVVLITGCARDLGRRSLGRFTSKLRLLESLPGSECLPMT